MYRKLYLSTLLLIFFGFAANAQTGGGSIKGKVLDKATGEPIPFANVIAERNGTQAGGSQTDFDGNFTIKPLTPGKYDIKASFVGFQAVQITGVVVAADKITYQDLNMSKGAVDISAVEVVAYSVPLIDKGSASTQKTVTKEDIQVAPTRDVRAVASQTAGVFQEDEGEALNVRGSRDNATDYYVDGIKVRGSTNIPQQGIEQVQIVTGGVPAQYGDATGGIINITTRGPSQSLFGGVELVTSEIFDDFGYNLAGFNVSGPILSKEDGDNKRTILGFFVSGEYQIEDDPDPSAVQMYGLTDEARQNLINNPIQLSPNGNNYVPSAFYLRQDDFTTIDNKQNIEREGIRFNAKLDFSPVDNVNFTFGGTYDRSDENRFIYTYSLLNPEGNPQRIDNTWRVFGRITQKLGNPSNNEEKSAATIKNAFYSLQIDYSKTTRVDQDPNHEDRLFDYGYIGQFSTTRERVFAAQPDQFGNDSAWTQVGWRDVEVAFTPGGVNPLTDSYTSTYYDLVGDQVTGNYQTLAQIQQNGGLLNGQRAGIVYSTWYNIGRVNNFYGTEDRSQFRVIGRASADIKNHAIVAGFEYEQRVDRDFGINPTGLWTQMRIRANSELEFLNDNPQTMNDTTIFDYSYIPSESTGFYENIRDQLGIGYTEWIDIDSYTPDNFDLELFTPDELLNDGNALATWSGYDHTGEVLSSQPTFEDFFTERDENGDPTRPIGAFQPIYMAGYIQDKFAINDLIFNIGVRVDRFDANQKVLKDKYLLYEARTAGEVSGSHPSNIGDDYVVYIGDPNNPDATIVGYRNEDTWYNASGDVISDPRLLEAATTTGTILPYLSDPANYSADSESSIRGDNFDPTKSFEDYTPQLTVMPRVAFSFPISDEASFFAHYDILTQRPPGRLRNDPVQYLYLETQGAILNNPNLRPERTVDYEIGFKQTLSRSSAMTISAFYRELKDMIQLNNVVSAYPVDYTTYENDDFGTVKGLVFGYDLRRTNNIRINANYTLQFADGTGSGDRSALTLINSDQPNLRTLTPLDFDQRHSLVVSFDYRYDGGDRYNGPMIGNTQVLAKTGLNLVFRAGSGTPYNSQSNITNENANIGLQSQGASRLEGSVNGSRLPWQFRVDARLDRDFDLKLGSKEKGNQKGVSLNVYILIQNLLDAENVVQVYRATGNPNDDGYLASAEGQQFAQAQIDPQSFVDMYRIKMNRPDYYALPRRARIGAILNF